jgi:hypothetical protein
MPDRLPEIVQRFFLFNHGGDTMPIRPKDFVHIRNLSKASNRNGYCGGLDCTNRLDIEERIANAPFCKHCMARAQAALDAANSVPQLELELT